MSINVLYRFKIKDKRPKQLLKKLVNVQYKRINFDYIKTMPKKLLNEGTYESWATQTFGRCYNLDLPLETSIKDNEITIEIYGNKIGYNLGPWFDKFKDNLEVFRFDEYDDVETLFSNYIHYTYKNNKIIAKKRYEELGIKFNEILKLNNKQKLIDFLIIDDFDYKDFYFDFDLDYYNTIDYDAIITNFISVYPIFYKCLTNKYSNNLIIINKVLNSNANLYKYLNKSMQEKRDIIIKTLMSKNNLNILDKEKLYETIYKKIKEKYPNDMELIKLLIKNDPLYFKEYISIFYDNKEVALSALGVSYHSYGLFDLLSPRLKNDLDIAKKCCQYNPYKNGDKDFKKIYADNKEIALYALDFVDKNSYNCLLYDLSDRLKNDRDVVIKSLKIQPKSFRFISDRLKNDKEVVLAAIKVYGNNLQYASERYQKDSRLIKIAREQLLKYNRHEIFFLDMKKLIEEYQLKKCLTDEDLPS